MEKFKVKFNRNIIFLLECFQTVTKPFMLVFVSSFPELQVKKWINFAGKTFRQSYLSSTASKRTQINNFVMNSYFIAYDKRSGGGGGEAQTPCQVCFFLWQRLRMIAEGLQFYCCLVKDILLSLHFRRTHKSNHQSF